MTPFDAPLNFADGSHLPNTYLHLINKNKRLLVRVKNESYATALINPDKDTRPECRNCLNAHVLHM